MKKCISVLLVLAFLLIFGSFCTEEQIIIIRGEPQWVWAECVPNEYILNTCSKKIHKKTCGTAARIHDENRQYYEGAAYALFDDGYSF